MGMKIEMVPNRKIAKKGKCEKKNHNKCRERNEGEKKRKGQQYCLDCVIPYPQALLTCARSLKDS